MYSNRIPKKRSLITPALALIIILLVSLAAISGIATYTSVYNESIRTILQKNRALVNRIDGWILLKESLVEYSAKLLRESHWQPSMFEPFFNALVIANSDVVDFFFASTAGEDLYSVMGNNDFLEREWDNWFEVVADKPGKVIFLAPFFDDDSNEFVFTAVRTVHSENDSMGVIGIRIALATVATYVMEYNQGVSGAISFILDHYGYILMPPDDGYSPFSSREIVIYENIRNFDDSMDTFLVKDMLERGYVTGKGVVYVGSFLETTDWYVITRVKTQYIINNAAFAIFGIMATVLIATFGIGGGWVALHSVSKAMHKTKQAEEKSALLIESMPMACFFIDTDYTAIDCNRTAVELFAIKDSNAVIKIDTKTGKMNFCERNCESCVYRGKENCLARKYMIKNYKKVVCGIDEEDKAYMFVADQCQLALENGFHFYEHDHYNLFGDIIPCRVTIIPVMCKDEQAFACYLQDTRPTKEAREESRRREIAEEESREKTRFLAKMSHEIRTPLNSVMGITEIELRKGIHSQETEQAFLRIYSSSKLLLSIINDILDLSKVEAGKLEIINAEYGTMDFIMETVELNTIKMAKDTVRFKLVVDENLPTHLVGDILRLKQIVSNLLSNAFKYTKEGEVVLSFGAEETDEGINLTIKVSDTGRGMSNDEIEKLFAEFMRFNVESNQSIEGSGLGMAIVQWLTKLMNGDVHAESEPGVGTTIAAIIPQVSVSNITIGRELAMALERLEFSRRHLTNLPKLQINKVSHGKVLVVDDVETNLEVVQGILDLYEIKSETASCGRDALTKIQHGNVYDVIFMDHMMPDMDGVETTKAIHSLGYTGPIIALTANAVKDTESLFISSGFDGFIPKPIDIERLNEFLQKFIPEFSPDKQL